MCVTLAGTAGIAQNPFELLAEDSGHFMDELPEQFGTCKGAVGAIAVPQVSVA